MKFIKRPVEVEAMRVTGARLREWASHPGEMPPGSALVRHKHPRWTEDRIGLDVDTSNGRAIAWEGDWILLDAAGKWYPCTHDVFQRTYDPVGTSASECKRLRTQLGMEGEPQLGWNLRGLNT